MPEPLLIDTNVIIRHLTNDAPELAERARAIWKQVEAGTQTVETFESVIVEAVQVLFSRVAYHLTRAEVQRLLVSLLGLPGFKVARKRLLLRALDLFVTFPALDFVDVLAVAYAEHRSEKTITSFDRAFDCLPSINRFEPPALRSSDD